MNFIHMNHNKCYLLRELPLMSLEISSLLFFLMKLRISFTLQFPELIKSGVCISGFTWMKSTFFFFLPKRWVFSSQQPSPAMPFREGKWKESRCLLHRAAWTSSLSALSSFSVNEVQNAFLFKSKNLEASLLPL